jgi:hypothetical protein
MKNTALQSLKTHLVAVRIVGCCEVVWRAARDYINIIGGFVGQGMLFCAALQWCALRTHPHFLLFLKNL